MGRIPLLQSGMTRFNGRSVQLPPKQADPAYATKVHFAWANEVRKRAGHACQRCGKVGVRLFADHILELRDGGTWDLTNGQALCGSCHTIKTMLERTKRAFGPSPTKP